MYNQDTELLFPMRVIPDLEPLRGETWQTFVRSLMDPATPEIDRLSFVLFMVRTAGCVTCNSDAFRAMKGCTQCAMQAIRRFRGMDSELISQYAEAKGEVENYLSKKGIQVGSREGQDD